jgi:4-amino-4-deoxy-L-arabinose transferase-like glycosyltransferase
MQARLAEADTLVAAGVATAMAIFGLTQVDSPGGPRITSRWAPWLFYAAVGWCVLAKGLIGPAFIFGGCGMWLLVNRDWRGLRFFISPIGILLALGSVLPWIVLVKIRCPAMFDNLVFHHFGRFQGQFGTHAGRFGYFYLVPLLVLPWTPFVFLALWRLVRSGEFRDRRWVFLTCWFVPGMALLSWSSFKAKHYTIPLLPPLAVLAAVGGFDYLRHRYALGQRLRALLPLGIVVGCVAAAAAVELQHVTAAHAKAALVGLIGVGVLAMSYFESRRQAAWQLGAMFATAWLVAVGVQLFVMPVHDSYSAQTQLAQRVNDAVAPNQSLYMLDLPENQITYYLRPQVIRLDRLPEFELRVAEAASDWLFVLAPLRVAEKLARTGETHEIARCSQINSYLTERDRLVFLKFKRSETAQRTSAGESKKLE